MASSVHPTSMRRRRTTRSSSDGSSSARSPSSASPARRLRPATRSSGVCEDVQHTIVDTSITLLPLLPYIYSGFAHVMLNHSTMVRPLTFDFAETCARGRARRARRHVHVRRGAARRAHPHQRLCA